MLRAAVATTLVFVLLAAPALADVWTDIPDDQWEDDYGITAEQADAVADGFPDGTFRPYAAVTRGQFTKMSVDGLDVAKQDPATPTFSDVSRSHIFYQHIEGAADAGLIGGFADGTFRPGDPITRQQTNSILGRYLSNVELATRGYIKGTLPFQYASLADWYMSEGNFYLDGYDDGGQVLQTHRPGTAYLVYREVVLGSNNKLTPNATLSRAQAVALVVRTDEAVDEVSTPPSAPTSLATIPDSPARDGRPYVTGKTLAEGRVAVYDTFGGSTTEIAQGTADSGGNFSVRVPLLAEGTHSFTTKVKDENGLISPASAAIQYILDLTDPEGDILAPEADGAVNLRKPAFTVTASDAGGAGVETVTFAYRAAGAASFTTVSVDGTPQAGLYEAAWGDITLPDGLYEFRAIILDNAGNDALLGPIEVTVDLEAPTVELEEPVAPGIFFTEEVQPLFLARAADAAPPATPTAVPSGVARVDFYYAVETELPADPGDWETQDFTFLSSDDKTESRAVWGDVELEDGLYVLAVQSVDRAGNVSGLDTQEVVVDTVPPVAAITAPVTGARVAGGEPYAITWTVTDAYLPADPITLEYSLNDGADWVMIVDGTENDGSHMWDVPSADDDFDDTVRVRMTVTDGWGDATVVTTGLFTIDNTSPAPPTAVSHTDNDDNLGIDGRDFTVDWTPSTSTDVASQRVYILPFGTTPDLEGTDAHTPVATFADNTTATWTGTADLITDSAGDAFSLAIPYDIYVVAVDQAGRTGVSGVVTWELPDAPDGLATVDGDATDGVDGRDFELTGWTPSTSADVVAQLIYILPDGVALHLVGPSVRTPADTIGDNTTTTWQGDEALTTDGAGGTLVAGPYDLYVVAVDEDGRMRPSVPPADLTVVAP